MPVLYKVVAPMGNYTDNEGNEKTRWLNCGMIMKTQTGRVVLKLDSLPVNPVGGAGDDGGLWLQCFEADRDKGAPPQRQGQSRDSVATNNKHQSPEPPPQQASSVPPQFNDDDIPF